MNEKLQNRLSKRKIKDLKLLSLLEVTKAINNNFSTDQLFKLYEMILRDQLNIGKLALFSYDRKWELALSYGLDNDNLEINVEKDLLPFKEITEITTSNNTHFHLFDSLIPVFHKSNPLAYVLIGDYVEDKLEISPTIKHLPFIQTLTNIIVVAIENKKLAKENIRQEGMRRELELASQMQSMLFPPFLPNDERLQIGALYKPHHEVGGDYYDYIQLNENNIMFCLADVSGKGVSAALLMSNFQANLRALVATTTSLTELIRELNMKVLANAKGEKFITLFIAKYNPITKVLNYVNAGHNPPLLINNDTITELKVGCTGIGMFDDIPRIKEGIINISGHTTLLCYTDGLVEQPNDAGEEYGTERMANILSKYCNLSVNELNLKVIEDCESFMQNQPHFDDIALLSCHFK